MMAARRNRDALEELVYRADDCWRAVHAGVPSARAGLGKDDRRPLRRLDVDRHVAGPPRGAERDLGRPRLRRCRRTAITEWPEARHAEDQRGHVGGPPWLADDAYPIEHRHARPSTGNLVE